MTLCPLCGLGYGPEILKTWIPACAGMTICDWDDKMGRWDDKMGLGDDNVRLGDDNLGAGMTTWALG